MSSKVMIIGKDDAEAKKISAFFIVSGYSTVVFTSVHDAKLNYERNKYFLVASAYELNNEFGTELREWFVEMGYPQNFLLVSSKEEHKYVASGNNVPFMLMENVATKLPYILEEFRKRDEQMA
ncbi:MAG: hypothetical protein KBC17_03295 [Candidatus Pacebacteria bacterium]|nr:hypothetical protein [Candidatus Paceibacterota bacterium]